MRELLWLYAVTCCVFVIALICIVIGFIYNNTLMFCTGDFIFLPFSICSFFAYRKEWRKYEKRHGRYN